MTRVGIGYDIHRLAADRELILGGVKIRHERGLEGHSDADVVLHALMDALLGAAALGDIGTYFPPTDERFRGVSSLALLREVRRLVQNAGYHLVNADIVIVAERPRLAPHIQSMRERTADALGAEVEAVGIKATTNEGVGPEGRGEAISARAVVLMEKR